MHELKRTEHPGLKKIGDSITDKGRRLTVIGFVAGVDWEGSEWLAGRRGLASLYNDSNPVHVYTDEDEASQRAELLRAGWAESGKTAFYRPYLRETKGES